MKLFSLSSLVGIAAAASISKREYLGIDTENQLTNGTGCRAITVLFARGTTEPGNVGLVAGPPFFQALANKVGSANVTVQGVDYGATILGFLEGGDPTGSKTLAGLVATAKTKCPDTKLVMSGYSQGGQLVHNAAAMLSTSETAFVNSVVIFGDPDEDEAVGSIPSSKVKIICHTGDDICTKGDVIVAAHLTYAENAVEAATFVAEKAAL